jgi:anti-anti-sigma factor
MTDRLDIRERDEGACRIVELAGRVDALGSPALEASLLGSVREGRPRIVVDCADLSYISSSGLRALLVGLKAARAAGGGCALVALGNEPRRVIETTGFHRLFACVSDVAEATRLLSPER